MYKLAGVIARILLALIFFVSILIIINNILTIPDGYSMYQDMLGARGLPGIFAPLSILIQFIAGLTLILGFKIKLASYVLFAYSLVWAIIYFLNALSGQPSLLTCLQYLAIAGGLLYMAVNPNTGYSLDNWCAKRKK